MTAKPPKQRQNHVPPGPTPPAPTLPRIEVSGRAALGSFRETEREGSDEVFWMTWEPVAVENDIGVARVEVRRSGAR